MNPAMTIPATRRLTRAALPAALAAALAAMVSGAALAQERVIPGRATIPPPGELSPLPAPAPDRIAPGQGFAPSYQPADEDWDSEALLPPGNTRGEVESIALLNRLASERARERAAADAAARAEAEAAQLQYQHDLAAAEQARMEYELQLQRNQAEYDRALAEHARITAACRRGDRLACDQGWLAGGYVPPGR